MFLFNRNDTIDRILDEKLQPVDNILINILNINFWNGILINARFIGNRLGF